jgi:hypothetical protein
MEQRERLQVELYAHGGWWKDNTGRSGQVAEVHAKKGPLATVAALANTLGVEGWELADFASARHNSYYLSFQMTGADLVGDGLTDEDRDPLARSVAIRLG